MTLFSALADCWLGLCRKAPALHAATAVMLGDGGTYQSAEHGDGGRTGGPARVRYGIGIAVGSIRALFHDRMLRWFSFLAGLVILSLIAAEGWSMTHFDSLLSSYVWIPVGDSALTLFDLRLFLIEVICLSGFTLVLAALVNYRNAKNNGVPVSFRGAFSRVSRHAGTLAALSVTMAFVATLLLELTAQNEMTGQIEFALSMALFWLPYAYYFAPNGIFSALFFSFRIMVVNIILFLLALYVVPVIVLEGKELLSAFVGSVRLIRMTWRELLGCTLVFAAIILGVAAIGLLIGQSPALLSYDYDVFLQMARGQLLMTAACYGFLLGCGILMALGLAVLGVAAADLYGCARSASTSQEGEIAVPAVTEPPQ